MQVSVIIPVYNAEKYISECLDSVLEQTWTDLEIIVVDNNSTDGSLAILEAYRRKFTNKITVFSETKQGASAARNKGILEASGEWIQFLDADDLLMEDKIEHQLKLVNELVAFVAGSSQYRRGRKIAVNDYPNKEIKKGFFEMGGTGNTCANLWNKKYLLEVNSFDEALPDTQDPDLMFRLFQINENIIIDTVPKTIVRDINPDSLSKRDLKGSYQRHLQLRQRILDYYGLTKPEYLAKEQNYFLNMMYKYVRLLAVQDLDLGVEAYHKYLPKNFKPSFRKDINNPLWNVWAVWFLGFRRGEVWKNSVKGFLNF